MTTESLLRRVEAGSRAVGLPVTKLEGNLQEDDVGDGYVTGQIGSLLLRFVRDRGQEWLELGPKDARPPQFYSFQDVQIALGWKTIAQVLDMRDVEPLGEALKVVASRWPEIARSLSGSASSVGWKRVANAANARGEAFAARLR